MPQKSQLEWIGSHFDDFQQNGSGWKALCPAHDDSNSSLSINVGDKGGVVIHCHAGCHPDLILKTVGLSTSDLRPGVKRRSDIVATYDYTDVNGKLLYQVVRMEPKAFWQRKPKVGGGWDWKVKDVEHVLYRLPEVVNAERVFVVEGEKDADRLASLNLVATTVAGGAKAPWLDSYTEALRGKDVIVLPDNDLVGWDRAKDIARELVDVAKSVKLVELPGVGDKEDISDWLDKKGNRRPRLLGIVLRTEPYPTTLRPTGLRVTGDEPPTRRVPVGLLPPGGADTIKSGETPTDEKEPVGSPGAEEAEEGARVGRRVVGCASREFPVHALPKVLQPVITSIAKALPCPVDFPGALILPVLGTLIGRSRCVRVKSSWIEYPSLWVGVVGESGTRKSPSQKIITRPLYAIQNSLEKAFIEAVVKYKALKKEDKEKQSPPKMKQVLTTDATIEALKEVLDENPRGCIFLADELVGWARGIGQYKRGGGDDRQTWLSIHSGMSVVCNRKGATPVYLRDPFVSVAGGLQPDVITELINNSREDGFAARILFTYPDAPPPAEWTEEEVKDDFRFAALCDQLWNLKARADTLTFNEDAKELWIEAVNRIRHELPNVPTYLRPVWSKAEGHLARIALILFVVRQVSKETKSEKIDGPAMAGAIKLIDYFMAHAWQVYKIALLKEDDQPIAKMVNWLKRHEGSATARQAKQYGAAKDSEEAAKRFKKMEELGLGTITYGKQGNVRFTLK